MLRIIKVPIGGHKVRENDEKLTSEHLKLNYILVKYFPWGFFQSGIVVTFHKYAQLSTSMY